MPKEPKKKAPPEGWDNTPNAYRTRQMRTFTLSTEAIAALEEVRAASGESRSGCVERLILAAAEESDAPRKKVSRKA